MDQIKSTDQALEVLNRAAAKNTQMIEETFMGIKSDAVEMVQEVKALADDKNLLIHELISVIPQNQTLIYFGVVGVGSVLAGFTLTRAWR